MTSHRIFEPSGWPKNLGLQTPSAWCMLTVRRCVSCVLFLACGLPFVGVAQAQTASPSSAPYVLRTTARAVVTDVLVQDGKGNSVYGLPASAFHLFDNGNPVPLASFEEHTANDAVPKTTPAALPKDTYTNDPSRLPPVLNIVVIDIVAMSLPDQMFLAEQLDRFARTMPADSALAVYLRAGGHSVLIQDFSEDRERIRHTFQSALPHFPSPAARYQSGAETLAQIAVDLKELPGRKNVLWFSSGAPLSLDPIGFTLSPNLNLRVLFDDLERERIAVYPVDARGLTTAPSFGPQQSLMKEVAEATGGLAFYNTNGLQQAALHVIQNDRSFYTLGYTPANLQVDNKWHRVKVVADGRSLHLSYRRGYFADDAHVAYPDAVARTRLLQGGKSIQESPTIRREPIVFNASVQPFATGLPRPQIKEAPAPGMTRYRIHYAIPASSFQRTSVATASGSESQLTVGTGVLALNRNGTPLARKARQSVYGVSEQQLSRSPNAPVQLDQDIDLAHGDTYLYLVVWDPLGERVGTLNIPLQVPK